MFHASAKKCEGQSFSIQRQPGLLPVSGCCGSLTQVGHDFSSAAEAYRRAAAGEIRLYAVWPGEYSSDLFEIDDLNAFADAFGVERPDPHGPRSGVEAQPDG